MKQSDVIDHSHQYIHQSKTATAPYHIIFQNISLIIYPHVFPTATDTVLLAEHIHMLSTDEFLDITTGSGAIAIVAGLQGAKNGTAVDINPEAVKNAQVNFANHKLPIKAILSDMFEKIPDQKFDVIFSNPPYHDQTGPITDYLEYAIYGGKKYLQDLFKELPAHLKKAGKLLVTHAEWANPDYLEQLADEYNLRWKLIAKKPSSENPLRVYRLYEVRVA